MVPSPAWQPEVRGDLCVHTVSPAQLCRYIIYKKKLEGVVDIQSPKVLGGLKSEAYLAINPQGMMPVLALPDGTSLPESQVRSFAQ